MGEINGIPESTTVKKSSRKGEKHKKVFMQNLPRRQRISIWREEQFTFDGQESVNYQERRMVRKSKVGAAT